MSDIPHWDDGGPPEGSLGAQDPRVYGQVTWTGDVRPPQHVLEEAAAISCPDCNVNVEVRPFTLDADPLQLRTGWERIIAHDESCPWLAAHEAEETP